MLAIVLAALRSRRAATATLWLLSALVTTAATAAPCVIDTASRRAITLDAAGAPRAERMVTLDQTVTIGSLGIDGTSADTSGIAPALAALHDALTIPGSTDVETAEVDGSLGAPVNTGIEFAARDGVCDHMTIAGACPAGLNEAIVSRAVAASLNLHVGSKLPWSAPARSTPAPLRIVGLYQPIAAADPYWGDNLLRTDATTTSDAVFVTPETLQANAQTIRYVRLLIVAPDAIGRDGAGRIEDDIDAARIRSATEGLDFDSDFTALAQRIQDDGSYLTTAVDAVAAELVVLGWFALYLVLRTASAARRTERGLQLIRGVPKVRIATSATWQNALPILAGLPFGVVIGYALSRAIAGPLPTGQRLPSAELAVAVAVSVLVAALLAAVIAERRSARMPIPDLLRNTPARRGGWRGFVADAAVLAVAVAAVVQAHIAGNGSVGLGAAMPMLIAVVVAVLAARLLAPAARMLLPALLRRGRVTGVLTVTYLARRHGLDRLLIVLVVASAAVANATLAWQIASDAQATRAATELGAARVITYRGVSVAQVLADTRTADPGGRYLMAAASYPGGDVLGVDTGRLGAVLLHGTWPTATAISRALDVPAAAPSRVSGGPMALTVDVTTLPVPATGIGVDLTDPTGTPSTLWFGPLAAGAHTYTASLSGCVSGCDIVDLRVAYPPGAGTGDPPVRGFDAIVSSFGPAADPASDRLPLSNREQWRTSGAADVIGPVLSGGGDGLRITLSDDATSEEVEFDPRIYPIDAPLPLPALRAGPAPIDASTATVAPFADLSVPVDVTATTPLLPQLGTAGMLVDLTDALRLDGGAGTGAVPQVWLRAGTPPAIVARIRAAGTVVSDRTLGSVRAGFADQAPASVLRFTVAAALIALLAAVAAVAMADSYERGDDLAALRPHGLTARTAAWTAYTRRGCLATVALAAGLLSVVVARLIEAAPDTVFADGWRTPPLPHASALGWLSALAAALVPLALVAAVSARRQTRSLR